MLVKLINWLMELLFGKKKAPVNPDFLKGEIAQIKKENEVIEKKVEEVKKQKNKPSEIEDYFNKK